MYDITAIGELLIDFTPQGLSEGKMPLFSQNPGGAPCNVLVTASNLGMRTSFIGKVGRDGFGDFLESVLKDYGVDTKGLVKDSDAETTLAFVHLHPDGERDFSFYRSKGADKFLTPSDIDFSILDDTRLVHFGSISLTDEPSRSATLKALDYAVSGKKLISYDPNWRPPLWKDRDEGIGQMRKGLFYADIVKVSDEELSLLAGTSPGDIMAGIGVMQKTYRNIRILAVTMGKDGCYIAKMRGCGCCKDGENMLEPCGRSDQAAGLQNGQNGQTASDDFDFRRIPAVTNLSGHAVNAVDATGAGDCFTGALLTCLLRWQDRQGGPAGLENISIEVLEKYARYASSAAAFCVTKKGGIPSMPSLSDLPDIF